MAHLWQGIINEYRDWLPISEKEEIVTLQEGGTPLVYSDDLSDEVGARDRKSVV